MSLDLKVYPSELELLKTNIRDVLDPDLAEILDKAVAQDDGFVLRFQDDAQAEGFLDVVAEEAELAIGALPGDFDALLDRLEDQVDRGGFRA